MLRAALAGALAANAVPHGVAGIQGRRFTSPFGSPPGVGDSSAVSNVIWSTLNAGAAGLLARGILSRRSGAQFAFAVGAAIGAVSIAAYFSRVRAEGTDASD